MIVSIRDFLLTVIFPLGKGQQNPVIAFGQFDPADFSDATSLLIHTPPPSNSFASNHFSMVFHIFSFFIYVLVTSFPHLFIIFSICSVISFHCLLISPFHFSTQISLICL